MIVHESFLGDDFSAGRSQSATTIRIKGQTSTEIKVLGKIELDFT
jgi:hypothetical protein